MKNIFTKIKYSILLTVLMLCLYATPAFCTWGFLPNGNMFWYEADGTIAMDGWKLIDDDGDGYAFYYYFDENGVVLVDDITPDYMTVGYDGRWVDTSGYTPYVKVTNNQINDDKVLDYDARIQNNSNENKGITSSGQYLYWIDPEVSDAPKPSDEILIEVNADGTARTILGKNVELKEKADRKGYDPTIDKDMREHIISGDKYSKKVNGTIFNKTKWKDVMALKGSGATIVFENPSNNFNKSKGRIATHYFTYTDRTTECTLNIYDEDNGEILYSTSDFNYNAGSSFECIFPRKAKAIRFELEVNGQYTSRICYLRKCEFGFDREAYEDELYEDESEAIYRQAVGTESELDEDEEEYEDDGMGDTSVEGEGPDARWRRLHNISEEDYLADLEYDEEDYEALSDAMKASISEAKRKRAEADEARNRISGPAFDPDLKDRKPAVGPDGSSFVIPVGSSDED